MEGALSVKLHLACVLECTWGSTLMPSRVSCNRKEEKETKLKLRHWMTQGRRRCFGGPNVNSLVSPSTPSCTNQCQSKTLRKNKMKKAKVGTNMHTTIVCKHLVSMPSMEHVLFNNCTSTCHAHAHAHAFLE